jgi:hypothetical protein
MAIINSTQDYDFISTLTFDTASGNCNIRLYRGFVSEFSGTVYYRTGTSGPWTSLSVSDDGTTTFPVGDTTMQVANDWNKSGNTYMTQSFRDQSTNLTEIAISQKVSVSGVVGFLFAYNYARNCSSLTSLDVIDTSGISSAGDNFLNSYALGCSSLTSLTAHNLSNVTSFGGGSLNFYAFGCSSLLSLGIPNTSNLTNLNSSFMVRYAFNCLALTSLELPAIGWFASNNVDWNLPSERLNNLKGYVQNSTDLSDWQGVTSSGETLHTNYIRSTNDVINENAITTPTVTTQAVSNIEQTTATGNGDVTNDGNANITERGIVYSTSSSPTTSDNKETSPGTTGSFTANLTNLDGLTTYYVRAYATNSEGTSYGLEVSFSTLETQEITTQEVTDIVNTTATGNGNIVSDGGYTITERGICWSTSENPTTSDNKATSAGTTGAYTVAMTGLVIDTVYYVRAYGISSAGTSYGNQVIFIGGTNPLPIKWNFFTWGN